MIESDTIKLLRECDAGIKMGIESINEVLKYVDDSRLHDVLTKMQRWPFRVTGTNTGNAGWISW